MLFTACLKTPEGSRLGSVQSDCAACRRTLHSSGGPHGFLTARSVSRNLRTSCGAGGSSTCSGGPSSLRSSSVTLNLAVESFWSSLPLHRPNLWCPLGPTQPRQLLLLCFWFHPMNSAFLFLCLCMVSRKREREERRGREIRDFRAFRGVYAPIVSTSSCCLMGEVARLGDETCNGENRLNTASSSLYKTLGLRITFDHFSVLQRYF
jgi:hypothetical protein